WPNGAKTPSRRWTRQLPPLKKRPCRKPTKKIGARYPCVTSSIMSTRNDEARMTNVECRRKSKCSNDERCSPPFWSFVIRHSDFVITRMSITYLEAIREAQAKLLRDDDRVFIYGQDVGGAFGGAFKATKGLAKEFPERVLNTPISEDAIVGAAIGAAMQGMRPIVEMQFADFSSIALNQILNNAGTHYWRTGVPVPITVRLPSGGTKGSGPFHSQSMESLYAHYPGLIVMTPATVEDAYTMLIEAVAIDDPVVYCEHKYLYYHLKADKLPDKGLPTGRARIAREGRDLTIVSYSAM